jgi:hypothetical protein
MWSWIIKVTFFSLLLIFLIHYLYSFFKTTLTVPKLKDLVNKPQAKYNTIYKSLQNTTAEGSLNLGDCTDDIGLDKEVQDNNGTLSKNSVMKNELMNYVKELSASSSSDILTSNDVVATHTMNYDGLSNDNAGGIATRVNNNINYIPEINNTQPNTKSTSSTLDYGTPDMSSSYSSSYSPY